MTDMTLDELPGMAPEQELTAKLRQDAFMIWGPHTNPSKPEKENDAIRKDYLSFLAARFRGVLLSLHGERPKMDKALSFTKTRR